jgi:excisionase family DNA binding protein
MDTTDKIELLTAREVSRLLRVKSATLYQAAADGRIPCVRLWQGRRKALIRFRLSDIQDLIEKRHLVPGARQI